MGRRQRSRTDMRILAARRAWGEGRPRPGKVVTAWLRRAISEKYVDDLLEKVETDDLPFDHLFAGKRRMVVDPENYGGLGAQEPNSARDLQKFMKETGILTGYERPDWESGYVVEGGKKKSRIGKAIQKAIRKQIGDDRELYSSIQKVRKGLVKGETPIQQTLGVGKDNVRALTGMGHLLVDDFPQKKIWDEIQRYGVPSADSWKEIRKVADRFAELTADERREAMDRHEKEFKRWHLEGRQPSDRQRLSYWDARGLFQTHVQMETRAQKGKEDKEGADWLMGHFKQWAQRTTDLYEGPEGEPVRKLHELGSQVKPWRLKELQGLRKVEEDKYAYDLWRGFQGDDLAIVVSRDPVDVLRMSDHPKAVQAIQSCHSEGGSEFQCAIEEAQDGGMIAYVVKQSDIEGRDIDEGELFEDRDRGIEGIKPYARLRLRRFENDGVPGGLEVAVPELRTYGADFPDFATALTGWAREVQPEFHRGDAGYSKRPRDWRLTGGAYQDNTSTELFDNFFDRDDGDDGFGEPTEDQYDPYGEGYTVDDSPYYDPDGEDYEEDSGESEVTERSVEPWRYTDRMKDFWTWMTDNHPKVPNPNPRGTQKDITPSTLKGYTRGRTSYSARAREALGRYMARYEEERQRYAEGRAKGDIRASRVAAAWIVRLAAYSADFLQWARSTEHRNPQTGNRVKFDSLSAPEQAKIHERWKGSRGAGDPGLTDTGDETWQGGKIYRADVGRDSFVHFTPRSRARQILESGKLLANPPHEKFGIEGVQAISLGYGAHVPEVQTTHVKEDPEDPLVAVVFQTSTVPEHGHVEEVSWGGDVGLRDARVVGADEARGMLERAPRRISEDDMVVYGDGNKRTAKYSPAFMQWATSRKHRNPETDNLVEFVSLPAREQKLLYRQWSRGRDPAEERRRGPRGVVPVDRKEARRKAEILAYVVTSLGFQDQDVPLRDNSSQPWPAKGAGSIEVTDVRGKKHKVPVALSTAPAPEGNRAGGRRNVARGQITMRHEGEDDPGTPFGITIYLDESRTPAQLREDSSRLENEIYGALIHELTHAGDVLETPRGQEERKKKEPDRGREYHNRPSEVRAFKQQIADEIQRGMYFAYHDEEDPEWIGADADSVMELLAGSPTWERIRRDLNPENRRSVLKTVADVVRRFKRERGGKVAADSFEAWTQGRRFPNPNPRGRKRDLLFKSLPKAEQDRIRARWRGPGEAETEGNAPGKVRDPLFHTTSHASLEEIAENGLSPRSGGGTFEHGGYGEHSQGKVFLSDNPEAARAWQSKVFDQLENRHGDSDLEHRVPVMLRVKSRETERDEVGDEDVPGSRYVEDAVPPEDIEFWHPTKKRWTPVTEWGSDTDAEHAVSERDEDGVYVDDEAFMPGDDEAYDRDDEVQRRAEKERLRRERAEADRLHDERGRGEREKMYAEYMEPAARRRWIDKIKQEGAKAPIPALATKPGVFPPMWQLRLKVDERGEPHPDHPLKDTEKSEMTNKTARRVASLWLRMIIAKYSPEFHRAMYNRKFRHPETGNQVIFYSLPEDEQKKIHEQWAARKQLPQAVVRRKDFNRMRDESRDRERGIDPVEEQKAAQADRKEMAQELKRLKERNVPERLRDKERRRLIQEMESRRLKRKMEREKAFAEAQKSQAAPS